MKRNLDNLKTKIPFNKPHIGDKEIDYIKKAHSLGQLSGDGFYTQKCTHWIENNYKCKKALLTHSCTAALEMMAILAEVDSGDEVIMPSFTFTSTANAFVLHGAKPVFVDIRYDTLNIDEEQIESVISPRTKAIVVVHYAGIGCEMDLINKIAKRHNLFVFEDAAQGFLAKYKGKYLGTIGNLGAFSFHETKNVISGEGGAIIVNDNNFVRRAEIVREKGTNRSAFFRREVDKYTWVDVGSSYLPGEITAAFLMAQLKYARKITEKRIRIWKRYHRELKNLEDEGFIKRPTIPEGVEHNGHLYYALANTEKTRDGLIKYLRKHGVLAVFHYIPLHSSPAGKKFGMCAGKMLVTNKASKTLVRLPLYYDMSDKEQDYVIQLIYEYFKNN